MKSQEDKAAFFAALAAFTGIFESFIPMPVPFLRLGLANIPVSMGFALFSFRQMAYIMGFKVVMIHLFRGSLFSYPFLLALTGNLLVLLGISLFYRIFALPSGDPLQIKDQREKFSFVSVNVLAAFLHNLGQIMVSFLFLPFKAIVYYGVILLFLGTLFGLINGLICNRLYNRVIIRIFT